MIELSERIKNLSESQTIQMAKLGRELTAQGLDVINFSFGEPDFTTPDHIKIAAKEAIDQNYSYYTPVAGYPDLRKAICDKFKRENDLDYTPDQIVVSTGAKQAIANAVMVLVNPGDEVLVPTPYWVSYSEMIKLAEGVTKFIPSDITQNFKISAEQLEKSISPKTKLFMFSSPCNPTGTVYNREELAALVKVFEKHPNVYIISDEIYEHINFVEKHQSIAQFDSIKDRVIVINGLSKAFAMTGWRLGYLAAHKTIAQACDKMQSQITSATNSIAQRAAITALNYDLSATYAMREEFKKRRDLTYKLLQEIPGVKSYMPDGAFYFFPDVSAFFGKSNNGVVINTANELCLQILHNAHVALVTGEAFGDANCIRFSYAASEEKIIEGLRRVKEFLSNLK